MRSLKRSAICLFICLLSELARYMSNLKLKTGGGRGGMAYKAKFLLDALPLHPGVPAALDLLDHLLGDSVQVLGLKAELIVV